MEAGRLEGVSLELRLKGTGTKEELIDRLKPVQENKELLKKQLSQVNTSYAFQTSMESSEIPPLHLRVLGMQTLLYIQK